MKYEKNIAHISNGKMTRKELAKLRQNAVVKLDAGDPEAQYIIDAIDISAPVDKDIVFMGFCPNADFTNRQDIEWKENNICRFDFLKSKQQLTRFNDITVGDLIVLKKRQVIGKTMELYGYGYVTCVAYDEKNIRYLKMDWSKQDAIIEVPLLGCNSTVDIRSVDKVNDEMPEEFFEWLTQARFKNKA